MNEKIVLVILVLIVLSGCGYSEYDSFNEVGKCKYIRAKEFCNEQDLFIVGINVWMNKVTVGCEDEQEHVYEFKYQDGKCNDVQYAREKTCRYEFGD